jgi:predicted metal-dependent enzyme (double-stranded beta helix superfamily)
MNATHSNNQLAQLVDAVAEIVSDRHEEEVLTVMVAEQLAATLAEGLDLPTRFTEASAERYVMYPLHVDPAGRFSIASAVWNVGQSTPVHGHETWGVVGIHSGVEHERSYSKPRFEGDRPQFRGERSWRPGEVTVCCTTDDDVHQVSCEGDRPCVGIHIYGADIGTLPRRSYDLESGDVSWFTSWWNAVP